MFGIILFYSLVLFYQNYNSELTYGFKQIAIQGRYIFPVIGLIYVLFTYTLGQVKNTPIKIISLLIIIALFLIGGPIKFIIRYDMIFGYWFIG